MKSPYNKQIITYMNSEFSVVCHHDIGLANSVVKEELQRQNKLISSERPFKILQNETKIIKIGQAVLEIFNVKD